MKKYKANPDFVMREIAGEVLLVPVKEQAQKLNGMITFSETGSFLWKFLQTETDVDALVEALMQEYNVEKSIAYADIEKFIEDSLKRELVIEC